MVQAEAEILEKRMELPLNVFLKKTSEMLHSKLALSALPMRRKKNLIFQKIQQPCI